jgi:hypothetical protein
MFLLDVRPDPVQVGGVAGLVLLAIVVLILTTTFIVGFVFLLKFLQRRKANVSSGGAQPSSPNQ